MVLQKAVEEHAIAAPEGLDQGVAGQIVVQGIKGPPDTLHLLSEGFDLPGQQGLQAQPTSFVPVEGRTAVLPGVGQQGRSRQRSLGGGGHGGMGRGPTVPFPDDHEGGTTPAAAPLDLHFKTG